ncbi:MAG: Tungstate uptake system permease protein TupB [Firmicutes bacterium]|nr:Tungstate uptake system permease protein TupB [Bacillota bacterium]
MEWIAEGLLTALRMLATGEGEVYSIAWLTIRVSGSATLLSVIIGVPLGAYLGLVRFPGREAVRTVVNSTLGLPPVVVGLWVSLFLWRSGPLGGLRLMYTPYALVIAGCLIALPRVTALTMAGVMQVEEGLSLHIAALGANKWQMVWLIIREARLSVLAAVMAGFGSAVAEVGAAMAVGGNIRGHTRVLSTAIVLEVNRGNFPVAIALGFILLTLSYSVALVLTAMQQRRLWNAHG